MSKKTKVAVAISGAGRTLKNLIDRSKDGLPIEIVLVITTDAEAPGSDYAEEEDIKQIVWSERSPETYADVFFRLCGGVDLILLAGFNKHLIHIPTMWKNKVLNIHPTLIPAFCGKGWYGKKVHQKVLDRGVKISGCTVHFVDDKLDHGPIILQKAVDVEDDDTADTLAARVFEAECEAYPEAIWKVIDGVHVRERRVFRAR